MFIKNKLRILSLSVLTIISSHAHDVLLEVKGAAFIATGERFKDIYGRAAGMGGAEVTFNAWESCECWEWLSNFYGFVSADFLRKSVNSIGCCSPTKVDVTTIGIGLKYLFPFCYGDFYLGLGALPTNVRTKDCSPFVLPKTSQWGCGGIAKIGAYFDLPCSFFIDLFVDYQFVTVKPKCCPDSGIQFTKANLNGAIIGLGLGYRFN